MEEKRIGIICVSEMHLLKLLHFEGGFIQSIRKSEDTFGQIEILMAHPDLQVVRPGDYLIHIIPIYQQETVVVKGKEYQNVERIEPPRRERVNGGIL